MVRHLMSMTSGIVPVEEFDPNDTPCKSPEDETACSQLSRLGVNDSEPGRVWRYSQVDLAVVGEIAEKLTGLDSWQDIFNHYIGARLGVDPDQCHFRKPLGRDRLVVAGGLRCHIDEYSKVLQAISAKSLVQDSSLWDEAERPHSVGLPMVGGVGANNCTTESFAAGCRNGSMPQWRNWKEGVYWHYGLMQWIECASPNCEEGTVRISSPGLLGTYPWVDRGLLSGARPHWGVVYRADFVAWFAGHVSMGRSWTAQRCQTALGCRLPSTEGLLRRGLPVGKGQQPDRPCPLKTGWSQMSLDHGGVRSG